MRMSTWQEGGYVEEIGLRVWRKAKVIKEGGASSFHSFVVDDIELVVLTSLAHWLFSLSATLFSALSVSDRRSRP